MSKYQFRLEQDTLDSILVHGKPISSSQTLNDPSWEELAALPREDSKQSGRSDPPGGRVSRFPAWTSSVWMAIVALWLIIGGMLVLAVAVVDVSGFYALVLFFSPLLSMTVYEAITR